jgi:hypothetical protein
MNKHLLVLASAAAIGLGSSAALADKYNVSGFVGVNMGATWSDFDSDNTNCFCSRYGMDATTFVFGGQSRINVWLDRDMSLQLDAEGEGTTSIDQYNGSSDGRSGGIFGAHLSWREPKDHLIGVFAALQSQSNIDYDGTMAHVIVGVEAQKYWDQWTVYGQAGYMPLIADSDEYEPDGFWFGRAVARYFINPNDRLQAEFGYGNAEVNDHFGDFDVYIWGASWEHRYAGTPFSTGITYNGFYNQRDPNWAEEHVLQANFTIHFGDDSLDDQNREGATLDMPNFGRAFAWSYWVGR